MAKTKIRKQSAKALLASITKELAHSRVAESAQATIDKRRTAKLENPGS